MVQSIAKLHSTQHSDTESALSGILESPSLSYVHASVASTATTAEYRSADVLYDAVLSSIVNVTASNDGDRERD